MARTRSTSPKSKSPKRPLHAPSDNRLQGLFSKFARGISNITAHPVTFALAVLSVVAWAAFGPVTHYSEIWQLWINTSTTILTFLMVFLLQNAQMRDTRALHLKIDELIRALHGARNEMINLEDLSDAELEHYYNEFQKMHQRYTEQLEGRRKPPTG